MTLTAATVTTPVGPLSLLAEDGTLVSAGFRAAPEDLLARLRPARRRAGLRHVEDLGHITAATAAYFAGTVTALDGLAMDMAGSDHQRRVSDALRRIPPGTTISYAELASRVGNAAAVRAAGSACGRNLLAPFVPCHRVVRTDGTLGGYAYGLARKRWLLDHERRHAAVPPAPWPPPGTRVSAARSI